MIKGKTNRTEIERQGGGKIGETKDYFLINCLGGQFVMFADKEDKSLTPCLTGKVGNVVGAWEAWVTTWVVNELTKQPHLFVDIGAHAGYYGFLAASLGADVVLVEANKNYADMLKKSIELHEDKNIMLIDKALSDEAGERTFYAQNSLHGSSSLRKPKELEDVSKQKVKVATVDEVVPTSSRPVLIKIDAEGEEERIWDGAEEYRKALRPTFVIEYTPGLYSEEFFDKLNEYGIVTLVDFAGGEQPITRKQAEAHSNWITLAIRPKD